MEIEATIVQEAVPVLSPVLQDKKVTTDNDPTYRLCALICDAKRRNRKNIHHSSLLLNNYSNRLAELCSLCAKHKHASLKCKSLLRQTNRVKKLHNFVPLLKTINFQPLDAYNDIVENKNLENFSKFKAIIDSELKARKDLHGKVLEMKKLKNATELRIQETQKLIKQYPQKMGALSEVLFVVSILLKKVKNMRTSVEVFPNNSDHLNAYSLPKPLYCIYYYFFVQSLKKSSLQLSIIDTQKSTNSNIYERSVQATINSAAAIVFSLVRDKTEQTIVVNVFPHINGNVVAQDWKNALIANVFADQCGIVMKSQKQNITLPGLFFPWAQKIACLSLPESEQRPNVVSWSNHCNQTIVNDDIAMTTEQESNLCVDPLTFKNTEIVSLVVDKINQRLTNLAKLNDEIDSLYSTYEKNIEWKEISNIDYEMMVSCRHFPTVIASVDQIKESKAKTNEKRKPINTNATEQRTLKEINIQTIPENSFFADWDIAAQRFFRVTLGRNQISIDLIFVLSADYPSVPALVMLRSVRYSSATQSQQLQKKINLKEIDQIINVDNIKIKQQIALIYDSLDPVVY